MLPWQPARLARELHAKANNSNNADRFKEQPVSIPAVEADVVESEKEAAATKQRMVGQFKEGSFECISYSDN